MKKISGIAQAKSATLVVDGAQSIPHMETDVKKTGADLLAFSAHKMLGPTGIGVLYGKEELLEKMDPYQFGGEMIELVHFDKSTFTKPPLRFV